MGQTETKLETAEDSKGIVVEKLVFNPATGKLMAQTDQEFGDKKRCFAAIPMAMVPPEYKQDIEKLKKQTANSCKEFYQVQSKHRLGEEHERVEVPIWISRTDSDPKPRCSTTLKTLHDDWIPHLKNAIQDINDAAPGVMLHLCSNRDNAKVIVYGTRDERAFTRGNIDPMVNQKALVCLWDGWTGKKRTSCHELLHALFFLHEQQRSDGGDYLNYHTDDYPVKSQDYIVGITRFDPFSIMMYPESSDTFTRKAFSDRVWKLKNPEEVNVEMSELDKVALNIVFRPCKGPDYSPKKKPSGGLWYCGRKGATEKHNRPARRATDGTCGPTKYPNCPACRVLKNPVLEKIWAEDKWQGWSGFVYCGKYFGVQETGHDGYCGSNNGNACKDCMKYMHT